MPQYYTNTTRYFILHGYEARIPPATVQHQGIGTTHCGHAMKGTCPYHSISCNVHPICSPNCPGAHAFTAGTPCSQKTHNLMRNKIVWHLPLRKGDPKLKHPELQPDMGLLLNIVQISTYHGIYILKPAIPVICPVLKTNP